MPVRKGSFALLALSVPFMVPLQDPERRLVTGFVRDSLRNPIPMALIVSNGNSKVVADDSGYFVLRSTRGTMLNLEVRRIGFQPTAVDVGPGLDTLVHVVLTPIARRLTAIEVLASRSRTLELRGFYRRMNDQEKGILNGEFITQEEIEKRNPPRITFMMDMIQGVRVRKSKDPNPLHWEVLGSNGCYATVYVDGIRQARLAQQSNRPKDYLDEIVNPSAVAGIEVYRGATRAPAEFQSLNAGCAVILIWTK